MGRNWPSTNTPAASQPEGPASRPQAGAEGCCEAQQGAGLTLLPARVLLQELGATWAVLASYPPPPPQLLGVPGEGQKVAFKASMSSSVPCSRLQAGSCLGAAGPKHLPAQSRSAFAESQCHPYAAAGALPEAGRNHPAHSSLHSARLPTHCLLAPPGREFAQSQILPGFPKCGSHLPCTKRKLRHQGWQCRESPHAGVTRLSPSWHDGDVPRAGWERQGWVPRLLPRRVVSRGARCPPESPRLPAPRAPVRAEFA